MRTWLWVMRHPAPLAWAFAAAGLTWVGLRVAGLIPAPVSLPGVNDEPSFPDANAAFVGAIAFLLAAFILSFATPSRRTTAAVWALGLLTAAVATAVVALAG